MQKLQFRSRHLISYTIVWILVEKEHGNVTVLLLALKGCYFVDKRTSSVRWGV